MFITQRLFRIQHIPIFSRIISYTATQKMNTHHNAFTSQYVPGRIPEITLTPVESQIVDVLNRYAATYNSTTESDPVTLRITGGWVRDKLLGQISHDIDIGIDNCSGEVFVTGLKDWLDNANADGDLSEEDDVGKISKIHKIKKNPDKSKHLETCTTKLFGLDIDFVNLRSESYTEDSRIPTITTGTPYEDAHRRDATLNAMFFNLSTKKVEDYTGRGLEDLANGVLRTPLEPRKTFLDDPLRCLRLIRFASNYGFSVDEEALNAMREVGIRVALETKISRERIGVEVKKMMINKRGVIGALSAFQLLRDVNFACIFDLGDTNVEKGWLEENMRHFEDDVLVNIDDLDEFLMPIMEKNVVDISSLLNNGSDENDIVLFYSAIILNHWKGTRVKVGKKQQFVAMLCVLNGIKMPLRVAENVATITSNIDTYRNAVDHVEGWSRSDVAEKIILPYGEKWRVNLLVNCVLEVFESQNRMSSIDSVLGKYKRLDQLIEVQKLGECHKEPVLVNGKDLLKLSGKKPGPWLKPITEKLFKWQLDNPDKGREEMLEYLNSSSEIEL
jgi:tRNA nucleotidyltransferase (CCA-adding enzyme)